MLAEFFFIRDQCNVDRTKIVGSRQLIIVRESEKQCHSGTLVAN